MAFAQIYVQEEDPGAVGFGNEWVVPSTGLKFIRNSANTGWTPFGSAVVPNGGFYRSNSTIQLSGALTGNTGFAPISSPDFNTSLKVAGVNVATVNDLTNAWKTIESNIDSRIMEAMSLYTSKSSVSDSIAMHQGSVVGSTWNDPIVIPMPQYTSDSVTASTSNSTITIMYAPQYSTAAYRNEGDTEDVDPSVPGTSFISYAGGPGGTASAVRYVVVAQR
jgi:hypothetical protein